MILSSVELWSGWTTRELEDFEIAEARHAFVISWGCCSFDDPRSGLRKARLDAGGEVMSLDHTHDPDLISWVESPEIMLIFQCRTFRSG